MTCERLNLLQFCKLCGETPSALVSYIQMNPERIAEGIGTAFLLQWDRSVCCYNRKDEIGRIFAEFTCEQQARGRCTHKPISYNGRCSATQGPGQITQDGFPLAHKRAQVGYGAEKKKTLPQYQYNDCTIGAIPALWTLYCRLVKFVALVSFSGTGHTGSFDKFLGA